MLFRPIQLAIVDDHTLFRKTLKNYLTDHNVSVDIQAADMKELLSKLKETTVDILLMDLFLPGLSGQEAVIHLRNEYPHLKIIALSMNSDLAVVSCLLDAGIHGYISKADEPEELIHGIKAVSENRIYRNKIFTDALYYNKQNNIKGFAERFVTGLAEREKQILRLIWEEKSNKEIADAMFLGVRSVEKIRQDLKEKLGVKSTVGMLKYAIDKNIIGLNPLSSSLQY